MRERAIPFQISAIAPTRKSLLAEGREIMKSIQADSVNNATDNMTMSEIDAEIAAYRRDKREKSTAR